MPTIDEILTEERAEELPVISNVHRFRAELEELASRYQGKVVYFGKTRSTASFPSVPIANNFLDAAKGRFRANRVGAEVRVQWALP